MKMYKLLATRVTKRISSHGVYFVSRQIIVQRSTHLCSFCNFYHGRISKCMFNNNINKFMKYFKT